MGNAGTRDRLNETPDDDVEHRSSSIPEFGSLQRFMIDQLVRPLLAPLLVGGSVRP